MIQRILLALCLMLSAAAFRHSNPPAEPGMMPYTPNRLEWLALTLEANYGSQYNPNSGYNLMYIPTFPNTITIFVQYTDQTSAATIERVIENAEGFVHREATNYGLNSWVKVEARRDLTK